MKVRPANGTISKTVTRLGGQPVQVSAPEAREALERGVADAITFPWGSILLFGIDKTTKFHLDMPLYVVGFVWGMNKDFYNSLFHGEIPWHVEQTKCISSGDDMDEVVVEAT